MAVLLDTPVIVDHLRGDARAVRLLEQLFESEDRVWAATPTRTELLARVRDSERAALLEMFDILSWVEIDAAVADTAGELARRFGQSHSGIGTTDYLVAAAAVSIGARLVTLNVRHFPMFEGLVPAY